MEECAQKRSAFRTHGQRQGSLKQRRTGPEHDLIGRGIGRGEAIVRRTAKKAMCDSFRDRSTELYTSAF